jgi:hypothetical protein
MSQATFLAKALQYGAYGSLGDTYLHRAVREDALGVIHGRDAIVDEAIAIGAAFRHPEVTIVHDGPCLGIVEVAGQFEGGLWGMPRSAAPAYGTYREHRWSRHEGDRVLEDVVVGDRISLLAALGSDIEGAAAALGAANPMPPALGELRSGEGQLAVGPEAGFEGPGAEFVNALHRIWNGRRLDEIASLYTDDAIWHGPGGRRGGSADLRAWLARLLARLPDATLVFDQIDVDAERVACLWRLFGHVGGKRARLIGSTLLQVFEGRIVADDTLVDELALEATPYRPLLAL